MMSDPTPYSGDAGPIPDRIRDLDQRVRELESPTGSQRNLNSERVMATLAELEARTTRAVPMPNISLTALPSQNVSATSTVTLPTLDKLRDCRIDITAVPNVAEAARGALTVFATVTVSGQRISAEAVNLGPTSTPPGWLGATWSGFGAAATAGDVPVVVRLDCYNFTGTSYPLTLTNITLFVTPS